MNKKLISFFLNSELNSNGNSFPDRKREPSHSLATMYFVNHSLSTPFEVPKNTALKSPGFEKNSLSFLAILHTGNGISKPHKCKKL